MTYTVGNILRDPIRLGFPGTVPGFSRLLARCLAAFVVSHVSRVCISHKNTTFLIIPTNILTFTRLEKISIGIRPSATSHKEEGKREAEEDMQISDCRVWTETANGEEGICNGRPVSGKVCVILGGILVLVFSITLIT